MKRTSGCVWLVPGLSLVLSVLSVLGCGRLPPTHYYVLELTPPVPARAEADGRTGIDVGVQPFQVDPPYDQDRIVYRASDRPAEVGFYAYHRWASPISRMLAVAAADGLEGTPGLRSVEPAVAGRAYDAWLVGRLFELEEIDHEGGQDVSLRIELALRANDGRELWSGIYSARQTLRTTEVVDVVQSMNAALESAVAAARLPLERVLAGAPAE